MFDPFAIDSTTVFYALLGGVFPALFWLWFWLREDRTHPEPRWLILLSFIAGGLTIIFVLPIEWLMKEYIPQGFYLILGWALTEELGKYLATHFTAFKNKNFDEPIDALIYLITVALGFAAFENFLFIMKTISQQGNLAGLVIGNVRFIGAMLLHIVSSSAVGGMMALSFYAPRNIEHLFVIFGLILATALHTAFNYFIIRGDGQDLLTVLAVVWFLVVILLLFFERVKRIKKAQ